MTKVNLEPIIPLQNLHSAINTFDFSCLINISVFPILLKENLTHPQIENRKNKVLKQFNYALKEIGKLANIQKPITTYVARHSFATCLKQKGISTDIISESLGHQNLAITQAYLKDFENSILDEASLVLL